MQSFRLARTRRALPPAAFEAPAWEEAAAEEAPQPAPAPASAADAAASRALQDAGNALAEAGAYAAALREWEQALKLTPRRADLHESMARPAGRVRV
jgi:hypothetical protein